MWKFLQPFIKLWNGWEIRALILLSLTLQIILIVFGSKRKVTRNVWIKILLWSAYMTADWVATVALGILAKEGFGNNSSKLDHSLQSLWAPFLLLHLGGPDTITAYSLEDNQLWLRHLLGLAVQTGVVFYVFLISSDNIVLTFIAIPVFIAGIIKYGERTWVLRSSSTKNFRDSLLSDPDPGPDYIEIMEKTPNVDQNLVLLPKTVLPQRYSGSRDDHLSQAYYLFNRLKYLFADLILGYYERKDCHSMISPKLSKEAFELVEGELGFLYDMLYTKATIVYSKWGFLVRCISFFSSVFAWITFAIFVDEHAYSMVDISITYSLLIGAVALEVYALILIILSDWTKLWLVNNILKQVGIGKRWSRTISKYNLIKFCLRKNSTMWISIQKLLGIYEILEKHLNVDSQDVDSELQDLIFQQLKERSENIISIFDINLCKELLNHRGECVLGKMNCLERLKWSTIDVEFDHSLLLWYIATQLCYYQDKKNKISSTILDRSRKISLCLSDYMLYLLVMCPNMLPKGIGEIRYRDTCADLTRFFKRKRDKIGTKVDEACDELYQVDTRLLEKVKGDKTKSVLLYGCKLAHDINSLENVNDWDCKKKWEMMNEVWVELLTYAAVHCGWNEHAQQLRKGGELLTHVCILMAHFGLSEQYQIQKEYFHIREDKWILDLDCPSAFDPCLLPLLYLCLIPYWCREGFRRKVSQSRHQNIYSENSESRFSF